MFRLSLGKSIAASRFGPALFANNSVATTTTAAAISVPAAQRAYSSCNNSGGSKPGPKKPTRQLKVTYKRTFAVTIDKNELVPALICVAHAQQTKNGRWSVEEKARLNQCLLAKDIDPTRASALELQYLSDVVGTRSIDQCKQHLRYHYKQQQ